ncbi:G1/S-specific cyclin-D2-like [Argiope bruennichi]|uniref:G1/S-specific cyclin-D2-like n=1 Tax=Argiope bruennichi TaxID=94029 RepID=UPI002494DB37|nr:G1/S-specific cyclin-D2-like [Argiope bruennichi]
MELYCCESENVTRAYEDPVLNEDSRVFENLLVIEDRYVLSANYFKCTQSDLKPYMRTVVAEWMQEVCEEERCQDEVFPLAVNCLDRFLLLVRVDKSQLQLLGAVCLFLASKLRQSRPLTAERLCLYSDHSISVVQLISWELLVLNTLKWDLAAITPFDFVGHILKRLGIMKGEQLIRRHAHTFIGLCTTEVKFSMYPPSMIAAASVGAAIQGLSARLEHKWASANDLVFRLHEITGIEPGCLRSCWEQIEEIIVNRLAAATLPITSNGALPITMTTSHKLAEQQMDPQDLVQAETPTDVQDILY